MPAQVEPLCLFTFQRSALGKVLIMYDELFRSIFARLARADLRLVPCVACTLTFVSDDVGPAATDQRGPGLVQECPEGGRGAHAVYFGPGCAGGQIRQATHGPQDLHPGPGH